MWKSKLLLCPRSNHVDFNDDGNFPIEIVEAITILGITITQDLSWESHICYLVEKSNTRFDVLGQHWPDAASDELHVLYTAFVRSTVQYVCPVFVGLGKGLSYKLESVHKRAHKIIYGS